MTTFCHQIIFGQILMKPAIVYVVREWTWQYFYPLPRPPEHYHFSPLKGYTKRNYLPKYLVLDLIGKNFRFLDTQLLKIYQILEKIYNWQRHQSFSKFYQKLENVHPKFVKKLQNFGKTCFQNPKKWIYRFLVNLFEI